MCAHAHCVCACKCVCGVRLFELDLRQVFIEVIKWLEQVSEIPPHLMGPSHLKHAGPSKPCKGPASSLWIPRQRCFQAFRPKSEGRLSGSQVAALVSYT